MPMLLLKKFLVNKYKMPGQLTLNFNIKFFRPKLAKNTTLGLAHTLIAHIRDSTPPPPTQKIIINNKTNLQYQPEREDWWVPHPMQTSFLKCLLSLLQYRKDSCISRTFLLKFWAKNRGCGLYTRPFLSERVNWLVVVIN